MACRSNPTATVADLSVGERQRIEIVRCLLQEPKLLIMDEPTAVLTPQEADQLFRHLAAAGKRGLRGPLYFSHRLEEVKRLCHKATILRHGKVVATCRSAQGNGGEPRAGSWWAAIFTSVRAAKAPQDRRGALLARRMPASRRTGLSRLS